MELAKNESLDIYTHRYYRFRYNRLFTPGPDAVLEAGDVIVVIGKQNDLVRMAAIPS